jgi:hypothetical protein
MPPAALTLLVSFVTDFLIVAGSTVGGAMGGQGSLTVPGKGVLLFAVVMGVVAAARRVQALLAPSVLR